MIKIYRREYGSADLDTIEQNNFQLENKNIKKE